jgi:hypothetical protein
VESVTGAPPSSPAINQTTAYVFPKPTTENLEALLGSTGSTVPTGAQAAFEAAYRAQNPQMHNAENMDCATCHLAEGAQQKGHALGLTATNGFTHARSLARVDQRTSITNLHAFGYLGRDVAIMQRTANESVIVATHIEQALAPK